MNKDYKTKILVSLVSIFIGLLFGAIILMMTGNNPFLVFTGIFSSIFGSKYNFGEWIVYTVPLVLTGLSVAFAMKTGLFNIGAEGQFIVGAVTTLIAAKFLGTNDIENTSLFINLMHPIFCVFIGGLFAALYGGIVGLLKAKYQVHEVVVSIMLNYVAFYIANAILTSPFMTSTPGTEVNYNNSATLSNDFLSSFFKSGEQTARMNNGIFIAIFALFAFYYIFAKTNFGFEIKAVGLNRHAARSFGVNTNRKIIQTMLISGMFAGLAGSIYVLATPVGLAPFSGFLNFGFDGIAIALLGQLTAVGTLLSALLLAALRSGVKEMQGVPANIVDIIMGVIILTSALGIVYEKKITSFFKKSNDKGGR